MSDRCFGWRLLLSRRADGDLSRYEWEALDDHLAGCRECREAHESDRALHLAFTRADFALNHESSRLDDQILLALGMPERLSLRQRGFRWMGELWARWEAIPNLYLTQIAGGTLAAASLTAIFLLTALHPVEDTARALREVHRISAMRSNEPPVPLASLLDRPSPRAASLWTIPSLPRPHTPGTTAPPTSQSQPSGTTPTQKHGSLPDALVRS